MFSCRETIASSAYMLLACLKTLGCRAVEASEYFCVMEVSSATLHGAFHHRSGICFYTKEKRGMWEKHIRDNFHMQTFISTHFYLLLFSFLFIYCLSMYTVCIFFMCFFLHQHVVNGVYCICGTWACFLCNRCFISVKIVFTLVPVSLSAVCAIIGAVVTCPACRAVSFYIFI